MKNARRRSTRTLYSLAVPLLALAALVAWTSAKSVWLADATAEEVEAVAASDNASIFYLDAIAGWKDYSAVSRFSAIVETGTPVATNWYYDLTAEDVDAKIHERLAEKIGELSAYWSNAGLRFAVIFVPNRGASAVEWWWFYGLNADQVNASLAERRATLTVIEGYRSDKGTVYAGVMEGPTKQARPDN